MCHQDAESRIEALKIRLFNSLKIAKLYEEAESTYLDVISHHPTDTDTPDAIVDLKYSFVQMLTEQWKFEKAEKIAREVWEKRKKFNPLCEATKMSHRQMCSILGALGRFEECESMHRLVYHEGPKDAWALENGDGICNVLAQQGEYENAKMVQGVIWKERQKHDGLRHELTIRSGLAGIHFLEILVASIGNERRREAGEERNLLRKQVFQNEIEQMLRDIWDVRVPSEQINEVLDVGHKLGTILVAQGKFADAEGVFSEAWEGKKFNFGETSMQAMSTGSMLARALRLQGTRDKSERAAAIYQSIWDAQKSALKEDYDETMSVGDDLAQTLYLLEDYAGAELIYRRILDHKAKRYDRTIPKLLDVRYNLGQAIYMQGPDQYREAAKLFRDVYDKWNIESPRSATTLECGHMLAETLAGEVESLDVAVGVIRDVFTRRKNYSEKGSLYLKSGHLYGKLLLEQQQYHDAQRILKKLWDHRVDGADESPEEKRVRLRCGYLYGQSLFKDQKFILAKEVLESVANVQEGAFPAGAVEAVETSQLLEKARNKIPRRYRHS
ncbi:hypothetical protein MMC28_006174 [Mycoblastus sanguinarius]|nr:hypothetical protein [Mycoblastus sanguinarius]